MDPIFVGSLGILLLILLISFGLHIGLAMGFVGIVGIAFLKNFQVAIGVAALQPYTWASMYSLSVIPLFVLMGYFAMQGGVSRDLYDVGYKWLGRLHGGLAMGSAAATAAFGACTGSSIATSAAMGRVALPEMKRYKYDDMLATGTMAASGTLGVMMPPSINAVLYAVTCEQSVGQQLMAGVFPALLIAFLYMIMIWCRAKRNPMIGPPARDVTWNDSFKALWKVSLPLSVFIVMIGGIFGGLFTPTEGGAFGVLATLLIAVLRRKMNYANMKEALTGSTLVVGLSFLILISAGLFSMFLALSGVPVALSQFFVGIKLFSPKIIVIMILLVYVPLGMFIDSISMILLTMPALYPAIQQLQVDPIWFGVLVIAMVEIGLVTPPLGINVFVIKGLAPEVPLENIFKGITWFVIMTFVAVIIMVIFPPIVTWLPRKMG